MLILQSRNNTNNTITMKKIIILLLLAVAGVSNVMGQSGTITRYFYMTEQNHKVDTCDLSMNLKDGKPTALAFSMNHRDKKTYLLAIIDGNPDMYHCYKHIDKRINDFRNMLITAKEKFVQWSATAKDNNIKSFEKEIGKYKEVPILSFGAVIEGVRYYQKSEVPYVTSCTPYFNVDSEGNCSVFIGWKSLTFERTKGYSQGFWTSYPIKEEISFNNIFFNFTTVNQIQSLIDALDLETAKSDIVKEVDKNTDVDSLFK